MKKATLNDVALKAGVAKSTASIVLSNRPEATRYNAGTRDRIMKAAQALEYRPNFFATQLRATQRKLIMLCMSRLQNMYASQIAEAFEARATGEGYRLVLTGLQNKKNPYEFTSEIIGRQSVAALAIVGTNTEPYLPDEKVIALAGEGVHVVLIGREIDHANITQVLSDDELGLGQMVEHLHAQGRRRFWILTGPNQPFSAFSRRTRYIQKAVQALGLPEPAVIHAERVSADAGRQALQAYWQGKTPPDGVLATSDMLAYGAMRVLHEAGLRIGQDVALTGFDDLDPSACMLPSLTTVRIPMTDMGTCAAEILMDQFENRAERGQRVVWPTEVVIRESTCSKSDFP